MRNLSHAFLITVLVLTACNDKPGSNQTLILRDAPEKDYSGAKDDDLEPGAGDAVVAKPKDNVKDAHDQAPDPVADESGDENAEPIDSVIDLPSTDMPKPKPEPEPDPGVMGIIKNGVYNIKGVASKKCLQPLDKSKASESTIVQETCSTESAQRFQFTLVEDKFYQITNVNSLLSLEIKDAIVVNEGRITQNTYTRSTHQQFVIEALPNGAYNIKSRMSGGHCLDVSFGSMANGAFIQLWKECHLPNQQFTILPVP